MKIGLLMFLVAVQFTVLPFIHMASNNKPAQFHVAGQTIIYKSN
jgi:hypothetical protein